MMNEDKTNQKLAQGISYFEEIIQLMPNDRTALEFLAVAYDQTGNTLKRNRTVIQLADALLAEKDFKSAENLIPNLQEINTRQSLEAINRINAAINPNAKPTSTTNAKASDKPSEAFDPTDSVSRFAAIKPELELIQKLRSSEVISAGTAEVVEKTLFDLIALPNAVLISALCVIEKENSSECEKSLAYLADTCRTPPIPLEAFTIDPDCISRMPESAIRLRGIIPFVRVGDTMLVVTLNPTDDALRREVTAAAGCPCQFYLATPSAVEKAVEKLYPPGGATS